jgi:hypothetical protein
VTSTINKIKKLYNWHGFHLSTILYHQFNYITCFNYCSLCDYNSNRNWLIIRTLSVCVCLCVWNHIVTTFVLFFLPAKLECHKKNLPTISMSPETSIVWNDGASAETSQLNFPDIFTSTDLRYTWLALEKSRWKWRRNKIGTIIMFGKNKIFAATSFTQRNQYYSKNKQKLLKVLTVNYFLV